MHDENQRADYRQIKKYFPNSVNWDNPGKRMLWTAQKANAEPRICLHIWLTYRWLCCLLSETFNRLAIIQKKRNPYQITRMRSCSDYNCSLNISYHDQNLLIVFSRSSGSQTSNWYIWLIKQICIVELSPIYCLCDSLKKID